jgi:hypothetical protein
MRKSVEGEISFLIMASLGPLFSWNSPLMPPTFWVAMVMGGCVGDRW